MPPRTHATRGPHVPCHAEATGKYQPCRNPMIKVRSNTCKPTAVRSTLLCDQDAAEEITNLDFIKKSHIASSSRPEDGMNDMLTHMKEKAMIRRARRNSGMTTSHVSASSSNSKDEVLYDRTKEQSLDPRIYRPPSDEEDSTLNKLLD